MNASAARHVAREFVCGCEERRFATLSPVPPLACARSVRQVSRGVCALVRLDPVSGRGDTFPIKFGASRLRRLARFARVGAPPSAEKPDESSAQNSIKLDQSVTGIGGEAAAAAADDCTQSAGVFRALVSNERTALMAIDSRPACGPITRYIFAVCERCNDLGRRHRRRSGEMVVARSTQTCAFEFARRTRASFSEQAIERQASKLTNDKTGNLHRLRVRPIGNVLGDRFIGSFGRPFMCHPSAATAAAPDHTHVCLRTETQRNATCE